MKKSFLFPAPCKLVGMIMAIPSLIIGIILLSSDNTSMWSWLGDYDEVVAVVLTIALLLVAFSRERIEDEYTVHLRARSLVFAVIINYLIIIVATCVLFDFAYLYFMIVNLFTPLLIYIVHFNLSLLKLKNSLSNE